MAKVYDPILCMMVDKSATRTTDAKGGKYEIYGDVVTLKSVTPATVKYETSNGFVQTIGRKKWDELAKKVSDSKVKDAKYEIQYVPRTSTNGSRMTKIVEAMNATAAEERFFKQFPGLTGAKIYNTTKVSDGSASAIDKAIKAMDAEVKYLSHVKKAAEALGVDPSTLEDAGMKRGISDIMSKVTGAIVAKYNWSAGKLTLTGRK